MIYIVCALYVEAKPLIDKYALKKESLYAKFQIFSNEKIRLIISGLGRIKSAIAISYLFENSNVDDNDLIINIGYCASTNPYDKLYEIVNISQIKSAYSKKACYPDMLYKHNFIEGTLICHDEIIETYKNRDNIYIDMESIGFFESAGMYLKKDRIIILKIISDIITENRNERQVFDINNQMNLERVYEKIYDFIENLINFSIKEEEFSELEKEYILKISRILKLTDTMYYEFLNILKYLKLSKQDILAFLKEYEVIEIKSKVEGKKEFENIKKRIIKF